MGTLRGTADDGEGASDRSDCRLCPGFARSSHRRAGREVQGEGRGQADQVEGEEGLGLGGGDAFS